MKRFGFILMLFLLMLSIPVTVAASEIAIVVDGENLEFEYSPLMEKGRLLVPMRDFFTAVDAEVSWDNHTRTAFAVVDDLQVSIPIGSALPTVNDVPTAIDIPATFRANRTYIPLRFAAEALGGDVSWNPATGTVIIQTAGAAVTATAKNDKIDINTAQLGDLLRIDGMGEAVAAEIIAYRDTNGPYKSFAEIKNVPSVTNALFDVLVENVRIVLSEEGIGSWYGPKFHGNRTYFGEIFDMTLHTAAHPTLPLDTMVKVTYLKTGLSVWVRVNDRGPCQVRHPERIIDLSISASDLIGLTPHGLGKVKLEIVKER